MDVYETINSYPFLIDDKSTKIQTILILVLFCLYDFKHYQLNPKYL